MEAYAKLKGKIKEVYDTQSAFASAMGKSGAAISGRLHGNTAWKMNEVLKACTLLGIPFDQMSVFFNQNIRENLTNERR